MRSYLMPQLMLALTRKMFHVPGVAIGIIRHGKLDFQKAVGLADAASGTALSEDTIFDIGSCTKSFTALLAAMAVSEGKLDWDEPIITYWPEFTLSDPYVTRHLTARDMACHRSGLARHDMAFFDADFDRNEFIRRMQYLSFAAELRQQEEYQNQVIVAFGALLEKIYGVPWETLIREKIAAPLGIQVYFRGESIPEPYSKGHFVEKGRANVIPYQTCSADNPCGGIKLSLVDAIRYIQALLDGEFTRYTPELFKPHMPLDDTNLMPGEKNYNVGLGWMMVSYRGRKIVRHAGVVAGFFASMVLIPEEKSGYVILSNVINAPLVSIMEYVIKDTLLGNGLRNYPGLMKKYYARVEAAAKKPQEEAVVAIPCSMELSAFCGAYFDDGYGEAQVVEENGALFFLIRASKTSLHHRTGNTFTGTVPVYNAPMMLHFQVDLSGRISSLDLYGFGNQKKLCTMKRIGEGE